MRGQASAYKSCTATAGITPADAGTSARICSSVRSPTDHPRGCGDKDSLPDSPDTCGGSPPRMRGQASPFQQGDSLHGITPADAGTSSSSRSSLSQSQDHPRGCGDKKSSCQLEHPTYGSPPRMRGKVAPVEKLVTASGITPADAGTSLFPLYCGRYSADHPRGCGDKGAIILLFTGLRGSPPRMRGQVSPSAEVFQFVRITPADAGTREQTTFTKRFPKDHPRGCGDKSSIFPPKRF